MRNMELIFATGNAGKLREAQQICDLIGPKYGLMVKVLPMPDKVDIPETGSSYRENSLQKAEYIWNRYHRPCIADDSGMEVDALGGGPGIYTARYCDRDFSKGIGKLLKEMEELAACTPELRRGSFVCCMTLIAGGVSYQFQESCPGTIADRPCGNAGFGFDPVFIADSAPGRCMAELADDVKNRISHRALAMEAMFRFLATDGKDLIER